MNEKIKMGIILALNLILLMIFIISMNIYLEFQGHILFYIIGAFNVVLFLYFYYNTVMWQLNKGAFNK